MAFVIDKLNKNKLLTKKMTIIKKLMGKKGEAVFVLWLTKVNFLQVLIGSISFYH